MKLILMIFLTLSSITQYAPPVIAQTKKPATTKKPPSTKKPGSVPKKPPRGLTPVPGRRRGMSRRDNCPAVKIPLTAIAPFQEQQKVRKQTNKSTIGVVGGRTTLERPLFLFYLPYTQDLAGSSAEFSLQDSQGTDVFRQKTALPAKSGVVSVSLPNTVKSLEVGQNYRWYFKVRCSSQTGRPPIYVNGYIQRINLDPRIIQELNTAADNQQKSKIYAKEGIWFDALNMLAQLRQSSQNTSVEKDWQTLLESVELNNIATAPLVNSPLNK